MSKKLTIKMKMYIGFAAVLGLTILVGLAGYFSMNTIIGEVYMNRKTSIVQKSIDQATDHIQQYLSNDFEEGRQAQAKETEQALSALDQALGLAKGLQDSAGADQDYNANIEKVIAEIGQFKTVFEQYIQSDRVKIASANFKEKNQQLLALFKDAWKSEAVKTKLELFIGASAVYFDRNTEARQQQTTSALEGLREESKKYLEFVGDGETLLPIARQFAAMTEVYQSELDKYIAETIKQGKIKKEMAASQDQLELLFSNLSEIMLKKLTSVESTAIIVIFVSVVLAIILGAMVSFFLMLFFARSIQRTTNLLRNMSDGRFSERIEVEQRDELGLLDDEMNKLADSLELTIDDISQIMGAVANGDLSCQVSVAVKG
ncbi:MAG: HAMP domain-containing protein, partial [bacterium]